MPANYTQNYQLNQWAADDLVQRTDFNADNAKIDAALKSAADARSTLSTQVAAKAAQSALTAEVNARTALAGQVAKKGNCQIYHTSYVGDGENTKTLTFSGKPLLIFIMSGGFYMHMVQGADMAVGTNGGSTGTYSNVTWSGNSVTWTFFSGGYGSTECCNRDGVTYYLIALIDAAAE